MTLKTNRRCISYVKVRRILKKHESQVNDALLKGPFTARQVRELLQTEIRLIWHHIWEGR